MSPGDRRWFGQPFDPKNNSLNLLRLVLATSVLFHHSFPLTGSGEGPEFLGDRIGGWAVIGFFALSGYLVTASRRNKPIGTFLALRVARIYPAFVVCNLVTVLLIAPAAWIHTTGTIDGYTTTSTTPIEYLVANAALRMQAYDVASLPLGVPYPHVWNGSLWSLSLEFLCYLIVAVIFLVPFAAQSTVLISLAWLGSVAARLVYVFCGDQLGLGAEIGIVTKFVAYFLAGAVLQMLKRKVGMHWFAAVIAAGIFGLATWLAPSWGGQAAGVALAYVLLWLGSVLKSPAAIQDHDVSYGMYIYAFQVQQMIAVFGGWHWGYWQFSLAALIATAPAAVLSWFLVEKPIMGWTRQRLIANRSSRSAIFRRISL